MLQPADARLPTALSQPCSAGTEAPAAAATAAQHAGRWRGPPAAVRARAAAARGAGTAAPHPVMELVSPRRHRSRLALRRSVPHADDASRLPLQLAVMAPPVADAALADDDGAPATAVAWPSLAAGVQPLPAVEEQHALAAASGPAAVTPSPPPLPPPVAARDASLSSAVPMPPHPASIEEVVTPASLHAQRAQSHATCVSENAALPDVRLPRAAKAPRDGAAGAAQRLGGSDGDRHARGDNREPRSRSRRRSSSRHRSRSKERSSAQHRSRSRSRHRSFSRRRSRERHRSSSRSRERRTWRPAPRALGLPHAACMPRFLPSDDIHATVQALRVSGWVCSAGVHERTIRKMYGWQPIAAAVLGLQRLPERAARLEHRGSVDDLAVRLCCDAKPECWRLQWRPEPWRGAASRGRSRSRSRSRGRAERDARQRSNWSERRCSLGRSQRRESRERSRERSDAAPERVAPPVVVPPACAPPASTLAPPPPPPVAAPPLPLHSPPPQPPPLQQPAVAPRYHYRSPAGAVEGPFRLRTFASWTASGALSAADAAALRVWPVGAPESEHAALSELLLAAAAASTQQRAV
jgi:hypothetical protein